jgi:hypothetical protein
LGGRIHPREVCTKVRPSRTRETTFEEAKT